MSSITASGKVVGKGCVGECGGPNNIEYVVESRINVMMVVRNVETSLCPNTGAFAFLFINGREAARGPITKDGSAIAAEAAPKDIVVVHVVTYPLYNGIQCIREGELKFNLIQFDLVN